MPLPEPLAIPFGYCLKEQYRQGLVGHWKMNVNSGIVLPDLSGNGNHGTLTNMANPPTATSGWAGQGLSFDGGNDCVDAGSRSSLNITQQITISAWVFPTYFAASYYPAIVAKGASTGKMTITMEGSSGVIWVYLGGFGYWSTGIQLLSVNKWYHITTTVGGNTQSLYVNGILRASRIIVSNNLNTTVSGNLQIGKLDSGPNYFTGSLDDVRIYNRALSAAEVAHAYYQQEDEWDLGLDDDLAVMLGIMRMNMQVMNRKDDMSVINRKDDMAVMNRKDDMSVINRKDDNIIIQRKRNIEVQ
jgi:hypothetical protein